MKNGFPNEKIKLEPNSKPYLFKRIISDGFDTVVVFLLFFVISMAIFASPLSKTYMDHYENYKKVEESAVEKYGDDSAAIGDFLENDAYYRDERFAANLHGYLMKLLAGFIAEAAVVLVVPLITKTRGTPGKLLTKIMPISERRRARASQLQIIGRFAFIFIIDSALLYLVTGIYTFLLVPVIRLTVMLLNKKNKTICDVITGVTVIEKLSYDGIDTF